MFYLSKVEGNMYSVTDTSDNVTESFPAETIISYIVKGTIIHGVALSLTEDKKLFLKVSKVYTKAEIEDYINRKPIYDLSCILAHKLLYFIKALNPQKVEALGDKEYERQTYELLLNCDSAHINEQICFLEHMTVPAKMSFTITDLVKDYKKLLQLKSTLK